MIDQPRLTPRIIDTVKTLLYIYLTLSVTETAALPLAGMQLYYAACTPSPPGPRAGSPKNASGGFYDSVALDVVLIVFMALAAVSFALYFRLYNR